MAKTRNNSNLNTGKEQNQTHKDAMDKEAQTEQFQPFEDTGNNSGGAEMRGCNDFQNTKKT